MGKKCIIEEILFVGTGSSSCTPLIACLMAEKPTCRVCVDASRPGPSKNRRLNPSALIRYRPSSGGPLRNILIDCGKTFYQAAKEWMVRDLVGPLDAVLITHGHADAILGMDDLRHFTGHGIIQDSLEVWADKQAMGVIGAAFPYLVSKSSATGGGFVSDLRFNVIEEPYKTFHIGELSVTPIPVEHGEYSDGRPYECLGFLLGDDQVVYISDASSIPSRTMSLIRDKDLMVLDCLREHRPYKSHLVLPQSLQVIREARTRTTFLIGMAHDVEHDEFEERIQQLAPGKGIRPAFDGLVLKLTTAASAAASRDG